MEPSLNVYHLLLTNVTLTRCIYFENINFFLYFSNIKNIIQNIDTEVYCIISLLFNKSDGFNLNFEVVAFTKVASEIPYTIPLYNIISYSIPVYSNDSYP